METTTMFKSLIGCLLASLALLPIAAQSVPLDVSGVRPGPVSVTSSDDEIVVEWPDENGRAWTASFSLDSDDALIRSIAVNDKDVAADIRPYYQGETGVRSKGWNAFFDYPPKHPDGTRHAQGVFELRSAAVKTVGDRVELFFDGLKMGIFEGGIAYTI